jgi:hypothetical protein
MWSPHAMRMWLRQFSALMRKQVSIKVPYNIQIECTVRRYYSCGIGRSPLVLAMLRCQRRPRCGLFCEILGPVFAILFLTMILGVEVTSSSFDASLHLHVPPDSGSEAARAAQLIAACPTDAKACDRVTVMGEQIVQARAGTPFDGKSNAEQLLYRSKDANMGLAQQKVLQFVPTVNSIALRNAVTRMVDAFRYRYPLLANYVRSDYADEESLEASIRDFEDSSGEPIVYAAVVLSSISPSWSYTLRGTTDFVVNSSNTLMTSEEMIHVAAFGEVPFQVLLQKGTHLLQDAVDQFIIEEEWNTATGVRARPAGAFLNRLLYLQPFASPAFTTGSMKDGSVQNLSLCFILAFLIPVMRLVNDVVSEKERRVTDIQLATGMSPSVHVASWLATYIAIFSLMSIGFMTVTSGVFSHSNKWHILMSVTATHRSTRLSCESFCRLVLTLRGISIRVLW